MILFITKQLSVEVLTKSFCFRWEFRSEDFDIGFGVSRKVKKGEEEVLVPLQRVNSQLVTEEGYLLCSDPGTCKYTFFHVFKIMI